MIILSGGLLYIFLLLLMLIFEVKKKEAGLLMSGLMLGILLAIGGLAASYLHGFDLYACFFLAGILFLFAGDYMKAVHTDKELLSDILLSLSAILFLISFSYLFYSSLGHWLLFLAGTFFLLLLKAAFLPQLRCWNSDLLLFSRSLLSFKLIFLFTLTSSLINTPLLGWAGLFGVLAVIFDLTARRSLHHSIIHQAYILFHYASLGLLVLSFL